MIERLQGSLPLAQAPDLASRRPGDAGSPSFSDVLGSAVEEARASEQQAVQAGNQFAAGDPGIGLHEVMIAQEKAGISVRYAVTLKNRVLESYRELMNTQV